jgi:hypothetical protein
LKTLLQWFLILLVVGYAPLQAESLSRERQIEIIQNYMYVTGQSTQLPTQALGAIPGHHEVLPIKCGTPAVAEFFLNRDKFDKDLLLAMGVKLYERPSYDPAPHYTYDSPAGHFKVHYTTTGHHAVYNASRDSDHDSVPDYIEQVALILDSVYEHIMDTLGYPAPPPDGFYPSGGDDLYDVYLIDTSGGVFGLTYPDAEWIGGSGTYRATSFIQLDNDYQEAEFKTYNERPLDAVRVTFAHEFFHAVQFGINSREFEESQGVQRRYWMEMSATWMEDEIYDNINDYYSYLPYFFNVPRRSLQSFGNYHEYGSVVFAIFLSEKFGRDIIKDIWELCGSLGGDSAHFLIAADSAIRSASGGTYDWASAFREFALWNYFTGERSLYAPAGVGYSERDRYPAIPNTTVIEFPNGSTVTIPAIVNHTEYPVLQTTNGNPWNPEHNGAAYVQFHHLRTIVVKHDTLYWKCNSWSADTCTDSTQVPNWKPYDFISIDSMFSLYIRISDTSHLAPPQPWGLNIVYMADTVTGSIVVDKYLMNYAEPYQLQIPDYNQYWSVLMIVSPASDLWQAYVSPNYDFSLGYAVPEELGFTQPIPPRVLAPYPNPAIVSDMGGSPLRFKFRVPIDSFNEYAYSQPYLSVDIFNVAGEFVRNINTTVFPEPWGREIEFVVEWDMKNERDKAVASGVYIAVARLYSTESRKELLAEERAKVAIIR